MSLRHKRPENFAYQHSEALPGNPFVFRIVTDASRPFLREPPFLRLGKAD
jgi:hypothetical protein